MPKRSKVAVLRVTPRTVLADIHRCANWPACAKRSTPRRRRSSRTTSPGTTRSRRANTTPWQLEGTILALQQRAATPTSPACRTRRSSPTPSRARTSTTTCRIFKKYDIPVLYNFKHEDMKWVEYRPKAQMHVLDHIFPDGIQIPDYFFGKNIVHLPTMKCHIYTTTTGAMKNAFGGLLARTGTTRTRGSTRRWSISWRSRRRSTPACSRSWTAPPPATAPGRARCSRSSRTTCSRRRIRSRSTRSRRR